MSSAICFNMDLSSILLSGYGAQKLKSFFVKIENMVGEGDNAS